MILSAFWSLWGCDTYTQSLNALLPGRGTIFLTRILLLPVSDLRFRMRMVCSDTANMAPQGCNYTLCITQVFIFLSSHKPLSWFMGLRAAWGGSSAATSPIILWPS